MKRFLKYAITLFVVFALVPITTNAQMIKRSKQKTEQTLKKQKQTAPSSKSGKQPSSQAKPKTEQTQKKQVSTNSNESQAKKHSTMQAKNNSSPQKGKTPYTPKVEHITANGVTFEMVCVEGGTFTMGATVEQGSGTYKSDKLAHQVTLSSFYIGKYEVTQELWQAVMGNNPSKFTSDSRCPVEQVSWEDCQEFIRKLNQLSNRNFRLPTEAEWEYAARGGNQSHGYRYSGSDNPRSVAWFADGVISKPYPVGLKAPNELGLYDMSGNVLEWCHDWYDSYSSEHQTNPQGPSGFFRVFRGGATNYIPEGCSVSARYYDHSWSQNERLGLRLAADSL